MVKSQPRGTPTLTSSLVLSISRVLKLRCPSSTPPGSHYVSGVPLCSVTFGTSRIAESTTPSPCHWKPRMPNPRCSGFVPPVSPRIDGPDQIGRSPFAISTCLCFLHSPTPIRRYPMTTNSCLRSRVNHLAIFARSDDPLGFAIRHDYSSRRFSSTVKRSLSCLPRPVRPLLSRFLQ
jgi:hypothetical protein